MKNAFKNTPFYEKILYILSFTSLFTCSSYISVYFYLIGLNLNYAICIIPDHDTFESTIENDKETDDWAEMEIRKSANFNHNSKIFTELNGGINFLQYLFSNMLNLITEKMEFLILFES